MTGSFFKYCLVGAGNTAIGLSVIYLAMGVLQLPAASANAVGYALAFAVSFWLNRVWTFRSTAPVGKSLASFAVLCAIGYTLNLAAVMTAIHGAGVDPYIAQLFGVAVYALFVFAGSRFVVFRA